MNNGNELNILWLRPSTGENISTRRERIAEHLEKMGTDVNIVNTSGLDSLFATKEALTGNYDVIIGTVRIGVQLGYLLSKILRVPFIASVSDPLEAQRDDLPSFLYNILCLIEWNVLKRAEAVLFVHPGSYNDGKEYGIDGVLARNAVNYDAFANPSQEVINKTEQILINHDINIKKNIAIYIGGMTDNAHLKEIVETANVISDWEFVFVGKESGANISELVSEAENAQFLGTYDHELMPGFLYHSTAALCLVDNEVPLKVTEYGAAGLPTLGHPGKLKNVFSEEELIYVEPNPDKISQALQQIESDQEYAQRYSENLREYAKQNSWEDIAEKYYIVINELTTGDYEDHSIEK
jgi:glycosyltransferase involved in cell wall biosynthesis